MKLYDFVAAPNPRRVRIFLAEKGIDVPTEQVDLRARAQHEAAHLARNPLATVPVLELDDGTCISESVAICRYFEALHPEPALMGSGALGQAVVEMWQRRVELEGLMAAGEAFRNSTPGFKDRAITGTAKVAQIPGLAERGRARVGRFFAFLDGVLSGRNFVAGDDYSIADITALVTVDFARWSKLEPGTELANLTAWYRRVASRPSAQA